jgi:ADP-ribose pyrophosphatase YjhB (NUDIX family)
MPQVWRPNVTVAAIIEREGRFLLVEEKTFEGLRINQPAGHLEHGESLIDAVIRETLEESAHEIRPTALLGLYLRPTGTRDTDVTYLRVAFVARILRHDAQRQLDAQIVRTLWLTREEVAAQSGALRSPLVLRCIDDYIAGQRAPIEFVQWIAPSPLPLSQGERGNDLLPSPAKRE